MKILHFADTHLGHSAWGRLESDIGMSSRVGDVVRNLESMVDIALDQKVDIALFAGDAYRSADPSPTLQRAFLRPLSRLMTEGIPLVVILGNHDLPGMLNRASALEVASVLPLDGFILIDRPQSLQRISTAGGEIGIIGLPWVNRTRLLQDKDLVKLPAEKLLQKMAELLTGNVQNFLDNIPGDLPTVLLAHQAFIGVTREGSEHLLSWGDVPLLNSSIATHEKLAYSALGHYHSHQDLSPHGPVHAVYAGSLERLDFSDEGVAKGFVIAELEGKYFQPRFHKLPAREFLTLTIVIKENEDALQRLAETLEAKEIEESILRVVLVPEGGEDKQIDMGLLRKLLGKAHNFSLEIRRHQAEPRYKGAILSCSISPREAVESYLRTHQDDLTTGFRDEVCQYALEMVERAERGEVS